MIPAETPQIDIDQRAEAVGVGATIIDVRERVRTWPAMYPVSCSSRWASCPATRQDSTLASTPIRWQAGRVAGPALASSAPPFAPESAPLL